jgi:hypothetical protein
MNKLAVVDSALVGSWESVGTVEKNELQLRFEFSPDGRFSRQYFIEDGGVVEMDQDNFKLKGRSALATIVGKYPVADTDTLTLSALGASREFERVGTGNYPRDALVGVWKTSLLFQGANWDWTIEIGREKNYHFHLEARDEGRFTAAEGQWEMISKWDIRPIVGTYRVFARSDPLLDIWPFGTITLRRSR